ncbi:P-loop NTPase fold protein [Corynebacterium sp. Q4381]|uniref:KAP family P-loop NTPase fold protein n=1 Tax=Corynebacterium sp. Marseille-Q4381 TaxID=3121597 RepID=UPI002FE5447D
MSESWDDTAIKSSEEDKYGYAAYARRIGHAIKKIPKDAESTVFAITGAWGVGKTSVAQLLVRELHSKDSYPWSVVTFTPWATSSSDAMLVEFSQTIIGAIPRTQDGHIKQLLSEWLVKTTSYTSLIPGAVGDLSSGVSDLMSKRVESRNWENLLSDIQTEIQKHHTQILVIIDDLDRLPGPDLVNVLKVARLLGRIRDVHYLLVFDPGVIRNTLNATLDSQRTSQAEAYLEKFVQVSFPIPPLNEYQVERSLAEWLSHHQAFDTDDLRTNLQLTQGAVVHLLRTPRRLKRFKSRLSIHSDLIPLDEVLAGDLFLLTVIQTVSPDLYDRLWGLKMQLISGDSNYRTRLTSSYSRDTLSAASVAEGVDEQDKVEVQKILVALFPSISFSDRRGFHGSSAPRRSIAHVDYFDRYFVGHVPQGDVPDEKVRAALRQSAGGESQGLMQLLFENQRVASLAITKGRETPDLTPVECFNVAKTLIAALPQLQASGDGIFDPYFKLLDWIADLLLHVPAEAHFEDRIADALDAVPEPSVRELRSFISMAVDRGAGGDSWAKFFGRRTFRSISEFLTSKDESETIQAYPDIIFVMRYNLTAELVEHLCERDFYPTDLASRLPALFLYYDFAPEVPQHREVAQFDRASYAGLIRELPDSFTTKHQIRNLDTFPNGYLHQSNFDHSIRERMELSLLLPDAPSPDTQNSSEVS